MATNDVSFHNFMSEDVERNPTLHQAKLISPRRSELKPLPSRDGPRSYIPKIKNDKNVTKHKFLTQKRGER